MANFYILAYFFTILSTGLSSALAEENTVVNKKREARHLLQSKLCLVLGNCGGYQGGYNQGYNQGGYNQGYNQGGYNQGYNQGGYNQGYPYPPVNIGISQSQSSSNAGGGGYGISSYPNNYQYNGHRYQGYNGHRPGYFGNGFGSSNNQFNGVLYGGPDGYGYRRPLDYDDGYSNEEDYDDDYSRSAKSGD